MHVRLVKHWLGYRPGREFPGMADGVANTLVKRGIAVLVPTRPLNPVAAPREPLRRSSRR